MRKTLAIIALLFAVIFLSACTEGEAFDPGTGVEELSVSTEHQLPPDETMMPENVTTAATEFSSQPVTEATETESTEAGAVEPGVETMGTELETEPTVPEETAAATKQEKPLQETTPAADDSTTATEPTEPEQPEIEHTDNVPEATTPAETIPAETVPTTPMEETTEPEPTQQEEQEEPEPEFDIDYWIGYAKEYAAAKGLVLESTAVDCWDNPIGAGAHCIYLERDIQSRLNRYANDEDITDVWIWAVPTGDGCFNLYIGYA